MKGYNVERNMKRLGIVAFYDENGIVDSYFWYYLQSLQEVLSDIVIIINGNINLNDYKRMKSYAIEVICRKNAGYDIGAYKNFFSDYISRIDLDIYDEVVLANDTCFGPFISFKEIFNKMELSSCDFWGINYVDIGFLSHLQSYFLVFRRKVFSELEKYFEELPRDFATKGDACAKFENGLFHNLVKKQYQFSYFTTCGDLDIYRYPDIAIKKYNLPIMKKRCLSNDRFLKVHCEEAARFVEKKYGYDGEMIQEVARRKYGNLFRLDTDINMINDNTSIETDKIALQDEDIINFCKKNNEVYIYGAGYYGKKIAWIYRNYPNIKGFIVTKKEEDCEYIERLKIYERTEISDISAGIIVALNKENTDQIKPDLVKYVNVLYLWK